MGSRAITIYLKDGVAEDEQILRAWRTALREGRPQTLFRRLLAEGLLLLHEEGELPPAVHAAVDPRLLAAGAPPARARGRAFGRGGRHAEPAGRSEPSIPLSPSPSIPLSPSPSIPLSPSPSIPLSQEPLPPAAAKPARRLSPLFD